MIAKLLAEAKISSGFLGPLTARLVKKIFCCRGSKEHKALPEKLFEQYALVLKKSGISKAAAGHFHRSWCFSGTPDVEIRLVPAWETRGEITLFYEGGSTWICTGNLFRKENPAVEKGFFLRKKGNFPLLNAEKGKFLILNLKVRK